MIRSAFVLFALTPLAVAAPVPKESESEKIKKLYGEIVDPDKDCKFRLDGEKLLITMPGGKRYDYWDNHPELKPGDKQESLKNCPRVMRPLNGDFTMTVLFAVSLPDKAEPVFGKYAEAGAGIMVLSEGRMKRFGLHEFGGGKRFRMFTLEGSRGAAGIPADDHPGSVHIRLTRRDNLLKFAISDDGEKWSNLVSHDDVKESKLTVGVYGFSNSKSDTTAVVAKLYVESGEKK